MYKQNLALHNQKELIFHKTQPTKQGELAYLVMLIFLSNMWKVVLCYVLPALIDDP